MSVLPVTAAHQLADHDLQQRWLVTGLWADEAVGIIGGEPKCCKSFLALDLAVSVASATACLRRFSVTQPGRVLLYAAEDASHVVRRRLEGICAAADVHLQDIDIQVITATSLRLDLAADRDDLQHTVAQLRPRLLVLDPFVRLHRIDENSSAEVAPLLAYLRELQRCHHMAVAVVHHAKKAAGALRAGQALRGSSEFHAWGDSNLYLRRHRNELTLSVEHRAAASPEPVPLVLSAQGDAVSLEVTESSKPDHPPVDSLDQRITRELNDAQAPLSLAQLRSRCRVRNATLHARLVVLRTQGSVIKTPRGYRTAES